MTAAPTRFALPALGDAVAVFYAGLAPPTRAGAWVDMDGAPVGETDDAVEISPLYR